MLAHFCCSSMHNQSHKKNVSMNLFQKIQQLPLVSKFILNRYAPYRGAGIEIDKIDFNNYLDSIPAFICIIFMPLAYSISDGIVLGHLCYVIINILSGKFKRIKISMYILAAFFVLKFMM